MIQRTTIYWQAVKYLVKFASVLFMCSCGSSSQTVSIVLRFGQVYGTLPACRPRCDSPVGSGEFEASDSFQWSQSCVMCAMCELGAALMEDDALTTRMITAPMMVTSVVCSKSLFLTLYHQLGTKNRLISKPPRYWRKQCWKRSKLVINFSQGSAASLSSWGGQINNICVG